MKVRASFLSPLFVLILYILALASGLLQDKLISGGNDPCLSVIIISMLVYIIPAIIFCRLKGVGYSAKLNIKLFSPGKLGCVIMSSLVLICGTVLIRSAQIYLGGTKEPVFSMFGEYLNAAQGAEFLPKAMAFAVVPAICEEFVFRAILLTEYNEGGFGAVTASVISSLLSAMMFFDLEKLPVFFFCGIICCLVTYVTGSSLTAFIVHMLFGFYGIFAEKYVTRAIINPSNRVISLFTFSLLFLVLAFIMLSEFEHILRKNGKSGVPTPSYRLKKADDGETPDVAATEEEEEGTKKVIGDRTKMNIDAFFSPTFLLCILFFAAAVFGFS